MPSSMSTSVPQLNTDKNIESSSSERPISPTDGSSSTSDRPTSSAGPSNRNQQLEKIRQQDAQKRKQKLANQGMVVSTADEANSKPGAAAGITAGIAESLKLDYEEVGNGNNSKNQESDNTAASSSSGTKKLIVQESNGSFDIDSKIVAPQQLPIPLSFNPALASTSNPSSASPSTGNNGPHIRPTNPLSVDSPSGERTDLEWEVAPSNDVPIVATEAFTSSTNIDASQENRDESGNESEPSSPIRIPGLFDSENPIPFLTNPVPQNTKLLCKITRHKEGVEKLYPAYELFLETVINLPSSTSPTSTSPQNSNHTTSNHLGNANRNGNNGTGRDAESAGNNRTGAAIIQNENIFLMAARKRKKSKSSHYIITASKITSTKNKENVVGKVKSNFIGTEFTIYNDGRNPFKLKKDIPLPSPSILSKDKKAKEPVLEITNNDASDTTTSENDIREELACVIYDPNILGFKGPRKMTVLLPGLTSSNDRIRVQPKSEKETLRERVKEHGNGEVLVLHNKSPQWNEETHSYVLNFNGRVTLASVKNFQIVHDQDLDYIILQFGRISEDTFTIDFQYPMTPLQAFGIALSSFDAKLACE